MNFIEDIENISHDVFEENGWIIEYDDSTLQTIAGVDVEKAKSFDDCRGITGSVSVEANDYTSNMNKHSQKISNIMVS